MIQFIHFPIIIVSLFVVSLVSPSLSTNAVDTWCSRTPYPDVCNHIFNAKHFNPTKLSEFKTMARKIALDTALATETLTKQLGLNSPTEKESAALADCLHLYKITILQLNKTFSHKCSDFDIQTWLSSALTNLDTCRAGFADLHVAFPLLLNNNNVTKLISNSLAMNNYSKSNSETGYRRGFPTWVRARDRRLLQAESPKANVVVAQDGSGNYRTIAAALAAGRRSGSGRFVIYVKKGVYEENVVIGNEMKNIMLLGDGLRYTIVTGSRSVGGGSTTFNSATVFVSGERFIGRGITFRNTAGPENYQAVALMSGSDRSVFFRCGFEGYQDTLYAHSQRQFYRECYIYGTIDFIFGNAIVVLQNCIILVRKPIHGQECTVTAQGRMEPNQNTGISIHNSRVMAAADLEPVRSSVRTYLGRPWNQYSRTVYLQNYLDDLVNPAGWSEWSGDFGLNTLYYGEYKNFGPGSSTNNRVKWKGYRVITSATEASTFTVGNFIGGNSWLPETGVPFTAGL
ncbi:pectinesterase-like [Momordica charantia]|uniref:Pectinesterase n=1 Tax=Momordica charantia TaxID=3673 RepID=A0A6J1DZE7_MOMCH|nr:pectinesterase-like [Momordica charantia]